MAVEKDLFDRVEHGYADSNGVKIHYATIGEEMVAMLRWTQPGSNLPQKCHSSSRRRSVSTTVACW